jgi:hypothetical protein
MEVMINAYNILEGRHHSENLGMDRNITLQWIGRK